MLCGGRHAAGHSGLLLQRHAQRNTHPRWPDCGEPGAKAVSQLSEPRHLSHPVLGSVGHVRASIRNRISLEDRGTSRKGRLPDRPFRHCDDFKLRHYPLLCEPLAKIMVESDGRVTAIASQYKIQGCAAFFRQNRLVPTNCSPFFLPPRTPTRRSSKGQNATHGGEKG